MKSLRTVRYSLIAAAVAGAAFVPTMAAAGVSATAGVANMYLWRGQTLGGISGVPVVSGSLDYAHESGLFAGVWGSSGDTTFGYETDLYAGYGMSSDAFAFKVTAYDYSYNRTATPAATSLGLQELVLSASASGAFVDVIVGIDDLKDFNYVDVGYTMDKVTAKLGFMLIDDAVCAGAPVASCNYTHADVTYAYNANLAFTVSGIADSDDASAVVGQKDALFVVSYALPLDLK